MSVPAQSGDLSCPPPAPLVYQPLLPSFLPPPFFFPFSSLPPLPSFFPSSCLPPHFSLFSLPPFFLPDKHFLPFYENQNYLEGATTFLLESSDRTSWSLCAHLPRGHFHGTDTKYLLRAQCPIRTLEIPDLCFSGQRTGRVLGAQAITSLIRFAGWPAVLGRRQKPTG